MDQRELKNSEDEATFICNRLKGTRVAPANFEEFEKAMEKGGATILHFVCHGGSPDIVSQEIDLEGTDKLDSVQLEGMDGVKDACRSKKPFVFLNACETGRPIPALIGTGGFARAFIQVGASAMVAPLWSVRDSIAHDIALEFYQKLIDDSAKSLAEVIRSIRQKAYTTNQGEDTFAAYCFYGDPLARFHKLG